MSDSLEQIRSQALSLAAAERSELIECLLDSLDSGPDEAVEREWIETAQRRLQELTAGSVSGVPANEVFERIEGRNVQP